MTYKEYYKQCNALEELEEVVKKDISIALLLNPDRVAVIKRAMNEVVTEEGWK